MTAYNWRSENPEFAQQWESAKEAGVDALEDEARRRAFEGTSEPIFHQGMECGTIQKYSDTLTIFLLKGARPEKYRERVSTELTGKDGADLNLSVVFVEPTPKAD